MHSDFKDRKKGHCGWSMVTYRKNEIGEVCKNQSIWAAIKNTKKWVVYKQ